MKDLEFCKRLKQLRSQAGLTQAQLERLAGLQPTQISQYEIGSRTPGLQTIRALVTALGCTADQLIGY